MTPLKPRDFLVVLFLLVFSRDVFSQNSWGKPQGLVLSTSFTYRWVDEEGPSLNIINHELTWHLKAAFYVQKNWRTGLTSLQIFEKNDEANWENFFMAGPMMQYDLLPSLETPILLETGVFYGNFAPVVGDLLKRENTYFLNLGGSGEIPIGKQWYINAGLNYYPVINKVTDKDNFILYNLGISYFLGKR